MLLPAVSLHIGFLEELSEAVFAEATGDCSQSPQAAIVFSRAASQRLQTSRLGRGTRTICKKKVEQTSVLGPPSIQICNFAALPIADGPKEQWVVEQTSLSLARRCYTSFRATHCVCSRENAFSASPTNSENFSGVSGIRDCSLIRLISWAASA